MKIGIVYGLFEGPLCSKQLERILRQRGHSVVAPQDADCLLVHSGGWLMLDDLASNRLVYLIDPAYQDKRSVLRKSLKRLAYDAKHTSLRNVPAYTLRRGHNLWYLATKPAQWLEMRRRYHRRSIHSLVEQPNVTVYHTHSSSWHNPAIMAKASKLIPINGDHDVLWHACDNTLDEIGL